MKAPQIFYLTAYVIPSAEAGASAEAGG